MIRIECFAFGGLQAVFKIKLSSQLSPKHDTSSTNCKQTVILFHIHNPILDKKCPKLFNPWLFFFFNSWFIYLLCCTGTCRGKILWRLPCCSSSLCHYAVSSFSLSSPPCSPLPLGCTRWWWTRRPLCHTCSSPQGRICQSQPWRRRRLWYWRTCCARTWVCSGRQITAPFRSSSRTPQVQARPKRCQLGSGTNK